MPTDGVDDLSVAVSLRRVKVCVINVQKFHIVGVPDPHSTIVRTACHQVPIGLTVLHSKDCLKMTLFRGKLYNLPLQIEHDDCSVFRSDQYSRPLKLFVLQEQHRASTLATKLADTCWLIFGHVPQLNRPNFLVRSDEVTRPIRHPYNLVDNMLLWLEIFHYFRCLEEALERDKTHTSVTETDQKVVLVWVPR